MTTPNQLYCEIGQHYVKPNRMMGGTDLRICIRHWELQYRRQATRADVLGSVRTVTAEKVEPPG